MTKPASALDYKLAGASHFFYLWNFHWLEDPKLGGGDVGKLWWRVSLTQKKNRI